MNTAHIHTPDGVFAATFTDHGLAGLRFPRPSQSLTKAASGNALTTKQAAWLKTTERALLAILAGRNPRALPPLDLKSGTGFQQEVWRELQAIHPGETRSYSELAKQLKRPLAARAVGSACGANPVPLLIPCHRVLAANRRLGGFSGGLDWKRQLLKREGVAWDGA